MKIMLVLAVLFTAKVSANPGASLGELSWPEAEQHLRTAPLVILPFAAGAKEHGPHLPMNADQRLMEHLVAVAIREQPVLVAPPILHGWFPAFRQWPGTEVEDAGVFQSYVEQVARSLVRSGAKRILFLNTGIRQATGLPLSIAAREIRVDCGVPTLVVSWDDLETDEVASFSEQAWGGHADEIETAINLVLQPERVNMDRAVADPGKAPKDYPGYRPGLFSRDAGDPAHSETGLRGDPTLATAEKGRRALAVMEQNWLAALTGLAAEPVGVDRGCRREPSPPPAIQGEDRR